MAAQRKRLGELLVEAGLLTTEQLQRILLEQSNSGLKLGQYLIRRDVLKEGQIVDLISQQLRIKKYNSKEDMPSQGVSQLVPMEIAQRLQLVPLRRKGQLLTVAMVDPMDLAALDNVELLTNMEAEPVICTEQEFGELFYSMYGVTSEINNAMESMDAIPEEAGEAVSQGENDINVSNLHDMAEEAPIVRLMNSILTQAVREHASDIHISPEKNYIQLRFRIDGKLKEVPAPPKHVYLPIISRIKILANMDIAVSRIPQDGRFTFKLSDKEVHVRVSSLPTIYGENMVLRLLDRSGGIVSLDDLGLSKKDRAKMDHAISRPHGMILSTGPTGSGKSTTLYSILNRINDPDTNIVTLEDPVEYRIEKIRQVQLNRKAGMTFASGLRSILRQDPDVIMVGEIRDGETANIAVQAALTGHKMLSTLHTNDSGGAVTRLMEMGVEPFLVSSTLLCSIAQRLIRRICPHCKEPYEPSKELLASLGVQLKKEIVFYRGAGCRMCNNRGFLGRTGIFEILEISPHIQDMILRRASSLDIMRAATKAGNLTTLKDDAARKAALGITTLEEAASAVLA